MAYTVKKYGCDVSDVSPNDSWKGWINSSRFVIIRAGYTGSDSEMPATDAVFESNYAYARSKSCPAGAYYWTRANTVAKAQLEADYFYNLCAGKILPYGLWVDMEDEVIQTSNYLTVANAFCARLQSRGFTGIIGVYASQWRWYQGGGLYGLSRWYRWVASYGADDGQMVVTDVPNCYMQQYTTHPAGPGSYLWFDTNALFGTAPDGSEDPIPPSPGTWGKKKSSSAKGKKSLDTLVLEIFQGKWGNGSVREKKLTAAGYNYRTVQNRVNAVYRMAKETISGKYGNGAFRKKALGKDYDIVQDVVNILLK